MKKFKYDEEETIASNISLIGDYNCDVSDENISVSGGGSLHICVR